jgi:Zn-dependent peptidase ImmA (M78 family)
MKSRRIETQRFYLARLIAAAHVLSQDQHLLPVTDASTALQKLERSFAQEFLCPWASLDAYTDEHGLDDETLIEAAEHFHVSEYLVRSTLVNRGKVSRSRLPQG